MWCSDIIRRFCSQCRLKDSSCVVTMKPPARKSSRKRTQRDYANMHSGGNGDAHRWTKMFEGKKITLDNFRRMKGHELTIEWLDGDDTALKAPIVIEEPEDLGMKMPDSDFTVNDVAAIVGDDTPVEVIGVVQMSVMNVYYRYSSLSQTSLRSRIPRDGPLASGLNITVRRPTSETKSGTSFPWRYPGRLSPTKCFLPDWFAS
jgi:hypothetical protein